MLKKLRSGNTENLKDWYYLAYGEGSTKECAKKPKNWIRTYGRPIEKYLPRITFNLVLPICAIILWGLWGGVIPIIWKLLKNIYNLGEGTMGLILNSIVIAAIITFFVTVFSLLFGPRISEKFMLRSKYLVPFREWSMEFYGELYEFNYRYLKSDYLGVSPLQIINDYWQLHETLRYATRWIGKSKKENKSARDNIWKLLQLVDVFWHNLENSHRKEIPSEEKTKLFEAGIKKLDDAKQEVIAEKIKKHVESNRQTYINIIDGLNSYLEKKVP